MPSNSKNQMRLQVFISSNKEEVHTDYPKKSPEAPKPRKKKRKPKLQEPNNQLKRKNSKEDVRYFGKLRKGGHPQNLQLISSQIIRNSQENITFHVWKAKRKRSQKQQRIISNPAPDDNLQKTSESLQNDRAIGSNVQKNISKNISDVTTATKTRQMTIAKNKKYQNKEKKKAPIKPDNEKIRTTMKTKKESYIKNFEESKYVNDWINSDPFHKLSFDHDQNYKDHTWINLPMPSSLRYTGAVLMNDFQQGLLHTFCRHWNQWSTYIPSLNTLLEGPLNCLKPLLEELVKAQSTEKKAIFGKFSDLLGSIEADDVFKGLYKAQWMIYGYMRAILLTHRYKGEGANTKAQPVVYFHNYGKSYVTFCFTPLVSHIVPGFTTTKPLRLLITAFIKEKRSLEKSLKNRKIFERRKKCK